MLGTELRHNPWKSIKTDNGKEDQIAPSLHKGKSQSNGKVQSVKKGKDISFDDLPSAGTGRSSKIIDQALSLSFLDFSLGWD